MGGSCAPDPGELRVRVRGCRPAAMALRAAVFDLDGVLALPAVFGVLGRTEEALALPR